MRFSLELARRFEGVLAEDELVIWTSRPALLATLCQILPQLFIPPLFLSVLYWGVFRFVWEWLPSRFYFLLALALMLLSIVVLLTAVCTTVYAVTNKSFRVSFWCFGYRHQTVGFGEMAAVDVVTNRLDQWLGGSTIRIYLGLFAAKQRKIYNRIVGIPEAERVCDLITRLTKANPLAPIVYAPGD
jgi:uncharacterized membrane protein YdbT with pleckstrin-like domain